MTQSFDLVLTGATIVNHDGEGVRDLAITGGRIAAIGNLSAASAGQMIDSRSCFYYRFNPPDGSVGEPGG